MKVVKQLKFNKAVSTDEINKLIQTGEDKLIKVTHNLIFKVWTEEKMPNWRNG